jgi:hypothetical protein
VTALLMSRPIDSSQVPCGHRYQTVGRDQIVGCLAIFGSPLPYLGVPQGHCHIWATKPARHGAAAAPSWALSFKMTQETIQDGFLVVASTLSSLQSRPTVAAWSCLIWVVLCGAADPLPDYWMCWIAPERRRDCVLCTVYCVLCTVETSETCAAARAGTGGKS